MHVKARSILESDSLQQHILAIGDAEEVVTHAFLLFRRVGNVLIARLVIPRIPQSLFCTFDTAKTLLENLPLRITHLSTLHRSPFSTVTVDDTLARNGNVLTIRSTDTWQHTTRFAILVDIQFLVGGEIDDSTMLQIETDVVLQHDRSREPHSSRDLDCTAALLRQFTDSLAESLRAKRLSVAHRTKIREFHFIGWDDRSCCLCHLGWKILIVSRIVLCLSSSCQPQQAHG